MKTSIFKKILAVILILSMTQITIQAQVSHAIFDGLLKKHVTAQGRVDYKGFIKNMPELDKYLKLLSDNSPEGKKWSKEDQEAYWINAYNAFTIKLITKYYPVKSIKDIAGKIPFVNTPWDIKFITIGGEKLDLNNIEHGKLRKQFDDPFVHMSIVCASKSCPILLNEAYVGSKLQAQFEKQTKAFLADSFRNKITTNKPQVSMIFKWYAGDFKDKFGSPTNFINKYSTVKIDSKASLSYVKYDWNLNE